MSSNDVRYKVNSSHCIDWCHSGEVQWPLAHTHPQFIVHVHMIRPTSIKRLRRLCLAGDCHASPTFIWINHRTQLKHFKVRFRVDIQTSWGSDYKSLRLLLGHFPFPSSSWPSVTLNGLGLHNCDADALSFHLGRSLSPTSSYSQVMRRLGWLELCNTSWMHLCPSTRAFPITCLAKCRQSLDQVQIGVAV